MHILQKAGGAAAIINALLYVIGFAVMATVLNPGSTESWSAAERLSFVLERKVLFQAWTTLIYVVFGLVLVVLAAALHERLKAASAHLMQITTAFGLIWSGLVIASGMVGSVGLEAVASLHATDPTRALSTWTAIGAVQNGLGGGVEVVGGLWVLLISQVARGAQGLPKALAYFGFVVGIAGLLTIAPPLAELGAVFGITQIVWFAWLGMVMLRRPIAN
ncbi:DUF4386 family protein [Pseudomarimonas arenosa]|uniref:DUF4386 family protein n=1 Tax=Pseudomarimonas arenosa TaxID=2774145 RepID=A0AAW3ZR72_9GAMM|nr:DUF4386 family protein [Pseudomarimonas arenosa]MBD8527062.1 DUF4386 family protein [Pseudomarimonas arenosa]